MQSGTAGIAEPTAAYQESNLTERHHNALEARGLRPEAAERLGWRACEGRGADPWFAIPYLDGDERVGTKMRTLPPPGTDKQITQVPGSAQILYNIDCLRDEGLDGFPLVITEGEVDCLAAIQCGYLKSVSVPGGAPEQDNGAEWKYLTHADDLLDDERIIIIATDNDRNGCVLQAGLAKRLGRGRCQIVEYPEGCKDLADVLKQQGEVGVRAVLMTAKFIPVPGLMKMSEMEEPPFREAHDTMLPGMTRHMRIRKGDLIVVTGPPGHGKSTVVSNILCNLAWTWSTVSAIASFEQPIVPDMRRVFRSYRAECLERDMSQEQKDTADTWIDSRFVFLQGTEGEEVTLSWLLERFAVAKQRFGAEVALVDPWNEISISDRPTDWTTEQWTSQSLRLIKSFARQNGMTIIIVAHPAKMRRDKFGKVPCPGLYDVADSAAFNNRCDLGVVVYRPDIMDDGNTEISVVKSRDHYSLGVPGTVSLRWEAETSRFISPL